MLDLQELLAGVKPNIVTPHLASLVDVKNERKPKTLAQLLVKHYHKTLDNPIAKQIYHQGEIHTIRYFDIEPLMVGVWAELSLILLNLSYAEQCDIIDALYPETAKLTAKAFAINFTKDAAEQTVIPVQDEDVSNRLDTTNVGIAMILATLSGMGGHLNAHPDLIARFYENMQIIAEEARERAKFKDAFNSGDAAAQYRDGR
jgi:hypothetical protein